VISVTPWLNATPGSSVSFVSGFGCASAAHNAADVMNQNKIVRRIFDMKRSYHIETRSVHPAKRRVSQSSHPSAASENTTIPLTSKQGLAIFISSR
jgi:hypothetical protein